MKWGQIIKTKVDLEIDEMGFAKDTILKKSNEKCSIFEKIKRKI